jgi:predicted HicB family RNase H-like nuclease
MPKDDKLVRVPNEVHRKLTNQKPYQTMSYGEYIGELLDENSERGSE